MMDRKCNFRIMKVQVPSALYEGTIFDCELVRERNGSYLVEVFDCLAVQGRMGGHYDYVTRNNIVTRFMEGWQRLWLQRPPLYFLAPNPELPSPPSEARQEALRFLSNIVIPEEEKKSPEWSLPENMVNPTSPPPPPIKQEEEREIMAELGIPEAFKKMREEAISVEMDAPFRLVPKRYYTLRQVYELTHDVVPTLPFEHDGMILQPVEDPIRMGPCPNILKFKLFHTLEVRNSCDRGVSLTC